MAETPLAAPGDMDLCEAADRLKRWRNNPASPRPGRQEMVDCIDVIGEMARILHDRLNGPIGHETPDPQPNDADSRRGYL